MYVLDGPAIVSVSLLIRNPNSANKVFLGLTKLVERGELCFCNEVLGELARTAKDEPPLVWATGCAASRHHKGPEYNAWIWVTHDFPALVDETARDTLESAAVQVVAQALVLDGAGQEVTVISEDVLPKPTRASVHQACEHFGLRCLRLLAFLDEVGLADEDDFDEAELDYGNGTDPDQ